MPLNSTPTSWERRYEVDAWPKTVCVLCEPIGTSLLADAGPVNGAEAASRETTPGRLRFRWEIISSADSQEPSIVQGIVRIPIHWDHYKPEHAVLSQESWKSQLVALKAAREFVVIRLKSASELYEGVFSEITRNAALITPGEVANRVALGHSRWFEAPE